MHLPNISLGSREQWKQAIYCSRYDLLHEGTKTAHLIYFGSVFFEGHGVYSSMGGILFLLGAAAVIFHEETD